VWEARHGDRWLRNVTDSVLIPVLPDDCENVTTAVIVAPGGAFRALSVDNEGLAVARWLAQRGIAAFVLIYRLVRTPRTTRSFYRSLTWLDEQVRAGTSDPGLVNPPAEALLDAAAAVALIRARLSGTERRHAQVGLIGFSAGGMLAIGRGAAAGVNRPDFVAALYPSLDVVPVMPSPPPLFIATCCDDPLFGRQGFGIAEAWNEAGGDVTLLSYAQGGHGFGMKRQGLPCDEWPERFLDWMQSLPRRTP